MTERISCPLCQTYVDEDTDLVPSGVTMMQRYTCPECNLMFGVDITRVPKVKELTNTCPNCRQRAYPCVVRPYSDNSALCVRCSVCDFKVESKSLTTLLHLLGKQDAL